MTYLWRKGVERATWVSFYPLRCPLTGINMALTWGSFVLVAFVRASCRMRLGTQEETRSIFEEPAEQQLATGSLCFNLARVPRIAIKIWPAGATPRLAFLPLAGAFIPRQKSWNITFHMWKYLRLVLVILMGPSHKLGESNGPTAAYLPIALRRLPPPHWWW